MATYMVSCLCGICEKTIDNNEKSSKFKDHKNHSKNDLNFLDFQRISGNNTDPWLYYKCTSITYHFGNLNNQNFHSFIHS